MPLLSRSHLRTLYARILGKGLWLKTAALLFFFLWLVKSSKNLLIIYLFSTWWSVAFFDFQYIWFQVFSFNCRSSDSCLWVFCYNRIYPPHEEKFSPVDSPHQRLSFSTWVFFHKHLQITGLQGKGKGISLTPHYHFHPLQRHLDISLVITAESSPLHIASSWTRTRNLWFPSASY